MADFELRRESPDGGADVLHLAGTFGPEGFEALQEELARLLAKETRRLGVEASGVEGMASYALGAIADAAARLRERGGALVLIAPADKVRGLVEALALGSCIAMADDMEKAKAVLAERG